MRPRRTIRLGLLVTIAFAASPVFTPRACAQGNSFNPFLDATNPYQGFVYPSAPLNYALPGAAKRSMDAQRGFGSGGNPYDQVFDPLNTDRDRFTEDGFGVRRPNNGIGVPYTQAFRQYDREFGRLNNASERADKAFYEGQQERYRLYLEATREKDPKKRAQMLKEVNQQAARAGRDRSFNKQAAPKAKADAPAAKASPAKPSSALLDPLSTPSTRSPNSRLGSTTARPATAKPDTAKPKALTIDTLRRGAARQPNVSPRMSDPLNSPLASDRIRSNAAGTPAKPGTATAPIDVVAPGTAEITNPPER